MLLYYCHVFIVMSKPKFLTMVLEAIAHYMDQLLKIQECLNEEQADSGPLALPLDIPGRSVYISVVKCIQLNRFIIVCSCSSSV